MFIHKAILEFILSSNTTITAPCATKMVEKLDSKDLNTGKTGFQMQFEVCVNLYTCAYLAMYPNCLETFRNHKQ